MAAFVEKRGFKRTPIELVVSCYLPTKCPDEDKFKGYAKDISPKGIKVILSHGVDVGDEIMLVLEQPMVLPILDPILVKGRIKRLKKVDAPPRKGQEAVEIGVEFIHISSYGSKRLDALIKEFDARNKKLKEE
jgi:c-di-GMP-binding flagellar brake protein YcgR